MHLSLQIPTVLKLKFCMQTALTLAKKCIKGIFEIQSEVFLSFLVLPSFTSNFSLSFTARKLKFCIQTAFIAAK